MQIIYVMRSEDEKCTKIGRSYNPNSRCESIILTEKKKYYLLYESKVLSREEAIELEIKIVENFKDFRIKGKEWLSVHPLEVIRYIISLIGIPKEEENKVFHEHSYKFDAWLDTNTSFKNASDFDDYIRIGKSSYIAYVKLLHNSKFITVGFANIGDAKKFVRRNRHKIEAVNKAVELLYGISHEQWKKEQYQLNYLAEWRLI